jgi:hypothetical protein
MSEELPTISIIMPGVEDFEGAIAAVRATGAHLVHSHVFEIVNPMTVAQVMALYRLPNWLDGANDPGHFTIEFENEPEDGDSLRDDAGAWYEQHGEYKPPCQTCQRREAQERRAADVARQKAEQAASRPAKHGTKWEDLEIEQLRQEHHARHTDLAAAVPGIAVAHGRTEGSIWDRLYTLNLITFDDLPQHIRESKGGR